jgi:MbtH protein
MILEDDNSNYVVLRNAEEQYSLWSDSLKVPDGWQVVAGPAPRAECLARIEELWTDMRPLSLREAMVQAAN